MMTTRQRIPFPLNLLLLLTGLLTAEQGNAFLLPINNNAPAALFASKCRSSSSYLSSSSSNNNDNNDEWQSDFDDLFPDKDDTMSAISDVVKAQAATDLSSCRTRQ